MIEFDRFLLDGWYFSSHMTMEFCMLSIFLTSAELSRHNVYPLHFGILHLDRPAAEIKRNKFILNLTKRR